MKQYLAPLIDSVQHNTSARFNCPYCNGKNTLSITKENNKVKWNCFKASCTLHSGASRYMASVSDIKSQLAARTEAKEVFSIPDYLVPGIASEKCLQMILNTNCLEPYKLGLFDIAYDPKQDRLCYLIKQNNKVVGIVGRAIKKGVLPKTLNYKGSNPSVPFIVGNSETVVLVEDCASACSVARIPQLTGLALLGTNLKDDYIPVIKKYKQVIVAMDRDARKKTLAIYLKLRYHVSHVEIWWLSEDIKDMNDETLLYQSKSLGINGSRA